MSRLRVLWIEDGAYNENTVLAAPVYLSGRFDLVIALSASDAVQALCAREYDAVVVDIRIPPGEDTRWLDEFYQFGKSNQAARLGLTLLRLIFDVNGSGLWRIHFPAFVRNPRRYGVLSVEGHGELREDLERMGIVVCRDKGTGDHPTVLLEVIEDVLKLRGEA